MIKPCVISLEKDSSEMTQDSQIPPFYDMLF